MIPNSCERIPVLTSNGIWKLPLELELLGIQSIRKEGTGK